ncbi:MAG: hypothetical protein B5M51_07320 [Anaerolinea sp. 4484_236]|nr:MAG: hypothetical protein B5M51_07320 [Anaerolinea sp. 4484_236]
MPKKDEVGFGKFTTLKIEILEKILGMHLAITQAVLKRRSYYKQSYRYIDVTAGKGYVPGSSMLGSPLVFIKASSSPNFAIPCNVDLFEKKEGNYQELISNFQTYSQQHAWQARNHVAFHLGKYEDLLPPLLPTVNSKELGLLFVDHSGDIPSFETINHVSQMRPRMEILIYIPARNIKRLYHRTNKSLADYMQEVSKKYWLIRKPVRWDNLEWTFLLGSNTDIFKNYKKIDFYRLDSSEAHAFFPKLNLTSKQRMEKVQPKLPNM